MIIVDTSVWISFLRKDNPDLFSQLRDYLNINEVIALSAVFGELLQGARNRREREIISGFWNNLPKVDERDIFLEAGYLSNKHKLFAKGIGLIDCYILAATLKSGALLWSLDKKLNEAVDVIMKEH